MGEALQCVCVRSLARSSASVYLSSNSFIRNPISLQPHYDNSLHFIFALAFTFRPRYVFVFVFAFIEMPLAHTLEPTVELALRPPSDTLEWATHIIKSHRRPEHEAPALASVKLSLGRSLASLSISSGVPRLSDR